MVTEYPFGLYLKVDISEERRLTFWAGEDLDNLDVIATDIFLSNELPLSNFNIFRIIVASLNNEPGAQIEDLRISVHPPKDAPLSLSSPFLSPFLQFQLTNANFLLLCYLSVCDAGEYLGEKTCRSCPDNSTSPLGSTSKEDCICELGHYYDGCFGKLFPPSES